MPSAATRTITNRELAERIRRLGIETIGFQVNETTRLRAVRGRACALTRNPLTHINREAGTAPPTAKSTGPDDLKLPRHLPHDPGRRRVRAAADRARQVPRPAPPEQGQGRALR